ncbi:DNA repair protein UVH3 isoform X2 [Neltuma alba]|uniref:DNA repair protein UVH3 isoform X2 n=1 Tax=Neltuma alba TaxID=207710 RepID=UPI0010A35817|nr:DNA repair protein UVH3-like isoform X2 [Prosopis alba]
MGVKGLWELFAPVGRRVSVETLAGKKLAIDASIWMVQFMKAMRDEKGEVVHNAHLLGFFRRICKLLFLRTKPVFVFDGGTPVLKRRTVIARRRQRENAQAKVRKTAEKLLLNHLKALKLKKLSDDVKNQRLEQNSGAKGQKKSDRTDLIGCDLGRNNEKEQDKICEAEADKNISKTAVSRSRNQEDLDAMLAASIVAEEDGLLAGKAPPGIVNPSDGEGDTDPEIILTALGTEVDLSVLAALPQSMQLDILSQIKGKKIEGLPKDSDNQKQFEVNEKGRGKGILLHEIDTAGGSSSSDDMVAKKCNQDKVDEMLAASILAEENEKFVNNASTSAGAFISEEEDYVNDEDEEMILPAMHGKVDPAVLASLPPSMQLDLLGQMRERLIADNRQKYQKVKKDPAKFSELQIQAYLKTVAFRREINEVQKVAAGGVVDGVRTSRIASEANREYIFSRSFTGDKQGLTSTGLEKNKDSHKKTQGNHFSQGFVNSSDPANESSTSSGLVCSEAGSPSDENIQTYLDDRGQFRVSRLRAMGMRMTRDIQRNLDLMKEIELERTVSNKAANNNAILSGEKNVASKRSVGTSDRSHVDLVGDNSRNEHPALAGDAPLEISFMDDGDNKCLNDDEDDLFASLVAGSNSVVFSCADNNSLKGQVSDSSSDCDWEEGTVEGKNDVNVEIKPSVAKDSYDDESDVEWEDGVCDDANTCAAKEQKKTSRGHLEEEADLQEAIRRSLEVMGDHKLNCTSSSHKHSNADEDKSDYVSNQDDNLVGPGAKGICDNFGVLNKDIGMGESTLQREGNTGHSESNYKTINDKMDSTTRSDKHVSQSPERQSKSSMAVDSKKTVSYIRKPHSTEIGSHAEDLLYTANDSTRNEIHMAAEQLTGTLNEDGEVSTNGNRSLVADSLGASEEEKKNCSHVAEPFGNYSEMPEPVAPFVGSSLEGLTEDLDTQSELPREENCGSFEKRRSNLGKDAIEPPGFLSAKDLETQSELPREDKHGSFEENKNNLVEDAMKAPGHLSADAVERGLEEEIRVLGQEYANLEYEQRKLERNAESVNNELFTECQELLQMFGLPYIIAPMEAEAQCAYLELAKLVDGVVTDDSDVFLFGARSVYKNIFDDRKYVETYFMEDVEKELGLTREKLIRMALLLGSDYTEGVSGIGIVNAIEVVNAFPEEDGLLKFRQWVESPDPTIFGRNETKSRSSTRKKGSKVEENVIGTNCNKETMVDQNVSLAQEHDSSDEVQEIKQIFMSKHRNVSKNWHIPSSFPSETVISAYSCPQVDKSTDPFSWGKPDHLVLRKLCWEKFGWTSQKADELLLPVLKEYNKNETQLRLEAFYTFNERFAKIRSKRIKKAVKGITGNHYSEFTNESGEDLSKSRKNETGIPAELGISKSETFKGTRESPADKKPVNLKQSRKRKNFGDTVAKTQSRKKGKLNAPASPSGLPEVVVQTGEEPEKGRSRSSKGREKGGRVPRGRRKRSLGIDSRKITSSDSDSDDHEPEVHGKNSRGTEEIRRSMRPRKIINYSTDNIEVEDPVISSDQSNKTDLNGEKIDEIFSGLHGVCANADSGFSRHKESTINFSPKKDLSRSYLESGGGFCTDEEKASHAGTSNCDSSRDADYLKVGGGFCLDEDETGGKHNEIRDGAYLRVGGGFCLDEDETGSKHDEIHDDAATIVEDSADLTPGCSGFADEAECGKNTAYQSSSVKKISGMELQDRENTKHKSEMNDDSVNTRGNYDRSESDTGVWISENAHGDTENAAAAFSAMPFLRKKKRKS